MSAGCVAQIPAIRATRVSKLTNALLNANPKFWRVLATASAQKKPSQHGWAGCSAKLYRVAANLLMLHRLAAGARELSP
jgi:hypothetical protein